MTHWSRCVPACTGLACSLALCPLGLCSLRPGVPAGLLDEPGVTPTTPSITRASSEAQSHQRPSCRRHHLLPAHWVWAQTQSKPQPLGRAPGHGLHSAAAPVCGARARQVAVGVGVVRSGLRPGSRPCAAQACAKPSIAASAGGFSSSFPDSTAPWRRRRASCRGGWASWRGRYLFIYS